MNFKCNMCGFCCQFHVYLTQEEMKRLDIRHKDYDITTDYIKKDGSFILKKKGSFCIFFKDNGCTIYEERPQMCRDFPFEADGTMSPKCRQAKEFSSRVDRRIIEFMNMEMKDGKKER